MSALPVLPPGRAGQLCLLGVYRYDLEIGANHEEIELSTGGLALSSFENDSSFEDARRRYQAASSLSDGIEESPALWFGEENSG